MKLNKTLFIMVFLFVNTVFAQNSATEISTKDGIHYITNTIDYPITGTYMFKGAEPIVELNSSGTGFYQSHEQLKREMAWGIECNSAGEPIFKKGYDSAEYTLWYRYTTSSEVDSDDDVIWKSVEFSIHFNSMKMFINGERVKSFSANLEEK
jgi:hypothetical protein